jgi:hypothetical protein
MTRREELADGAYCQAPRCAARIAPGGVLCDRHWRTVPSDLRARLAAALPLPPRLLFASLDESTLGLIELVAEALEAIAAAEETDPWNQYRFRVDTWRRAEARARRAHEDAGGDAGGGDDRSVMEGDACRGEASGALGGEGGGP